MSGFDVDLEVTGDYLQCDIIDHVSDDFSNQVVTFV
jgi:hypothetical protein